MTEHISPFDAIRKVDEQSGDEYWSARELSRILGYTEWRNFSKAITKAQEACRQSKQAVSDHFVEANKMVTLGSGAKRKTEDFHLTRYACYLIVQNADPTKPIVALGQTYFAVQTRRQELADQLAALPEEQKRIILRTEMAIFNAQLAETAQKAGVIQPDDFAIFQDHGYMGLYGGLRENDIHARKNLAQGQRILDYMGSEELGANIFRATQTDAKLKRDQVKTKGKANATHFQVGRKVRQTIKELGGTMPEDLPTPVKSVQELQQEEIERQQRRLQPSLFDEPDENEKEQTDE
jgi:DNA-damage-inducible protein D